ncbi:hypothetical protein VTL71DRAFT_7602 [Oculimacula yallundae]|uniref:Uncharacterized protein n=1 Tax=Oculimacula yallundae TaxID=86028 RepID=A0ABR4BUN0_9HELO
MDNTAIILLLLLLFVIFLLFSFDDRRERLMSQMDTVAGVGAADGDKIIDARALARISEMISYMNEARGKNGHIAGIRAQSAPAPGPVNAKALARVKEMIGNMKEVERKNAQTPVKLLAFILTILVAIHLVLLVCFLVKYFCSRSAPGSKLYMLHIRIRRVKETFGVGEGKEV